MGQQWGSTAPPGGVGVQGASPGDAFLRSVVFRSPMPSVGEPAESVSLAHADAPTRCGGHPASTEAGAPASTRLPTPRDVPA